MAALAVSQAVFALSHLPNLMLGNSGSGSGPAAVSVQVGIDFALGLLFAGLYYYTGNLFLVIGVHALMNAGLSAVRTPVDPALVLLLLSVVLLAVLAVRNARRRPAADGSGRPDSSALLSS